MSQSTRDIVVGALHKSIGIMNDPKHGPAIATGKDLEFAQVNIDSLDLFEVIMEIEDRMGLELDADDVAQQPSLNALVEYLERARV